MNTKEIDWTEEISEEDFKEILNENEPTVNICNLEMQQGNILFECDYTAFIEMYNNYIDVEEKNEGKYQCGECDTIYHDEQEAEECCQEEEEEDFICDSCAKEGLCFDCDKE